MKENEEKNEEMLRRIEELESKKDVKGLMLSFQKMIALATGDNYMKSLTQIELIRDAFMNYMLEEAKQHCTNEEIETTLAEKFEPIAKLTEDYTKALNQILKELNLDEVEVL